jgi:endo-1,3(4)-beta-glucanase
LPSNPLILHVGQYSSYMRDYVALGLSESSNSRPSGLIDDQWRDLWWNLWAMTDATSALEDFTEYGLNYDTEAGESKAHTYHWLHTFDTLGQLKVSSELASDYPAALVFEKNGSLNYVIYNFNSEPLVVSFSNGKVITALPNSFTIQKD